MPKLVSSLLIVNHPNPPEILIGADCVANWEKAMSLAYKNVYRVAALPLDVEEGLLLKVLDGLNYHNPEIVIIFVDIDKKLHLYQNSLTQFEIFQVIGGFDDVNFEKIIIEAIEHARQIDQSEELSRLVNQQTRRLSELQIDLEDRIRKRQKFLQDSRKKLTTTNNRVEALRLALVAIHQSSSISDMENLLTQALQEALKLSWIRIIFSSQNKLRTKLGQSRRLVSLFSTTLTKEQESLGDVYFARPLDNPFSRTERDFLRRIGDTISIALDRIVKLEELETLQQQWEVTFNAIASPLSIISENFEIIQTNKSFDQQTGLTSEALFGEKCYRALFDRDEPCENCQLGESFDLGQVNSALGKQFEFVVQSYKIRSSETVYVNLYRDQTQLRALERRILQSTKMVEIGTIGSSIAHELNNPIGGILNYLQLIKMETELDNEHYEDINEMETGAQRCKEIVQNLLSFTRKPGAQTSDEISVHDIIRRAMKIVDLQARSRGVAINFATDPGGDTTVQGQRGLLVQALTNVLQNSLDAVEEKKLDNRSHKGQIEITHFSEPDQEKIVVQDNGVGIASETLPKILNPLFSSKDPNLHSGLGLTLSFQIINELGGDIEIRSDKGVGTVVTVSILRPVFVESGTRI